MLRGFDEVHIHVQMRGGEIVISGTSHMVREVDEMENSASVFLINIIF